MRLTRLAAPGIPAPGIDLHRFVTVVTGLGPDGRARLGSMLGDALRGLPADVDGEVELQEERLPLLPATIEALGLPDRPPPVLWPAELPGARPAAVELEVEVPADIPTQPATARPAPTDPTRLSRALADLQRLDALRDRPDPEAVALADRWSALAARLAASEDEAGGPDPAVEAQTAAQAALDRAREELAAIEATGEGGGPPSAEDGRELEAAHARLLEAQDRAERRFAGPRARAAVAEAKAAEQVILDRMGLHSYADYVMRASFVGTDPDALRRLNEARAAVRAAEDALAEAAGRSPHPPGPDPALVAELAAVREEAARLLGRDPGDDVEEAVAALRAVPAVDHDLPAATERLLSALAEVGVEPGDDPVAEAERWLAEPHGEPQSQPEPQSEPGHEPAPDPAGPGVDLTGVEPGELEVYLLARIAAVRHAGRAGSVPFVVVDALAGASEPARTRALGLLARFADVVQIVYLSDDPGVQAWAERLGPERAAVRAVGATAAA